MKIKAGYYNFNILPLVWPMVYLCMYLDQENFQDSTFWFFYNIIHVELKGCQCAYLGINEIKPFSTSSTYKYTF